METSPEICKWFFIFVLFIGPVLCVIGMYIIAIIDTFENRNKSENKLVGKRSVKQWREDNLKAQEKMRRDSNWYIDKSK